MSNMYCFISSEGKKVKTKNLREFADTYSLKYNSVRQAACGYRWQVNGWCSTNPKAKKRRARFTTKLINLKTGEQHILGSAITVFAKKHNLHPIPLGELVRGQRQCYKDWMLYSTYETVRLAKTDINF